MSEDPTTTTPARQTLLADRAARLRIAPKPPRQYTARGRAEALCDTGSFVELFPYRQSSARSRNTDVDGDGVVVGRGLVDHRPVAVVSHDFTVAGGSIGAGFADKVVRAQRIAADRGWPIVFVNDSGGARIHEGVESLHGCGEIFRHNVTARRRIPQLSLIMGPCAGAAAYSPALTDWTFMVNGTSQMFLTGPEIVKAATGEVVDPEDIGGARLHTEHSGVAHLALASEAEAFASARHLLGFLPSAVGGALPIRSVEPPPTTREAALGSVVPTASSKPFDMRHFLDGVLDGTPRLELMPTWGPSMITCLAHLGGVPVAVVASQPKARGGILDSISSQKVARFVEFAGRIGLPILTFVDVPGFLPGSTEERRGVITWGAQVLTAYVEAASPRLTLVVRKAYGGAYIALGSRSLGADFTWALADAELAVMGPGGAVGLLHRRELAAAEDPVARRAELASAYREDVTRPGIAARSGIIDDVLLPEEVRPTMIGALLSAV